MKRVTENGCVPSTDNTCVNGSDSAMDVVDENRVTPARLMSQSDVGGVGGSDSADPQQARRKSKSVSFHSATSLPTERKISSVTDCLQYMINGSNLIKVRPNGRHYHRYFTLEEDLTVLRWTPTSKKSSKAIVPIANIREIRTGKNTEVLRLSAGNNYSEDCAFAVIYGDAFESLDLMAATPDEANIWVTGLNALIGEHQSPDGLVEKSSLRERWLENVFMQATQGRNGWLDEGTTLELLQRLASDADEERIRQKLTEIDKLKSTNRRGRIDSSEFVDVFKEVATRPEIYFLLIRFANKDYLTVEDLQRFLEGEQGVCAPSKEECRQIIEDYEPMPEARLNGQLLIDGFTKFLMSSECDIFDPNHRVVCQDMTQPLTCYFIASSHNTYLLEDQLKGPCSVEGYIRALAAGCRCVKVDCWDGPEEPVVFHGNTLTPKIYLRDVMIVINDYAFAVSSYPLFIHLENHCTLKQQLQIVEIIKEIIGTSLYIHPSNSSKPVTQMSPEELKGKILITGKRLSSEEQEDTGEVSEEDEGCEMNRRREPSKCIPLCAELSRLVSLARTHFQDFPTARRQQNYHEMSSLSESAAGKLAHAFSEDFVNHTKAFLTRVFPNGSRVDSSNYNPQDFWNCGCQMVALNWQTPGLMMDLCEGRFQQNGMCGYVLKPSVLRDAHTFFAAGAKDAVPGVSPQLLRLKIISGQHLPRPRGSTAKGNVIDPYVLVQVFGIPADCTERKTRTVSNEGDCPIFEESFEFHISLPELALVRFVVLDDDFIGDDFIGQYSCSFDCLQTGYRHVRLLSNTGEPLENSTLFVHVAITNRKGGGKPLKKKSKSDKMYPDFRSVGLKPLDDLFKATVPTLSEAAGIRTEAEFALEELRSECGLAEVGSVRQCLRVLALRLASCPEVTRFHLRYRDELPTLGVDSTTPLPPQLQRSLTCLERALQESHNVVKQAGDLLEQLQAHLSSLLELYEEMENQEGHSKKWPRVVENYAWNIRVLRGQTDLLQASKKECSVALQQVKNSAPTLESMGSRERHSSGGASNHSGNVGAARERPRLNLMSKRPSWEVLPPLPAPLGRSPTSPLPLTVDLKPKSILKKSNSSIEQGSLGYVRAALAAAKKTRASSSPTPSPPSSPIIIVAPTSSPLGDTDMSLKNSIAVANGQKRDCV